MNEANYQVIILDDDQKLGELLQDYLQNTGICNVTYVNEESDFWQCLTQQSFDIIFLDYKLPDTNGLEILARMGQAGLSIPTVMMTGEGSEHIAARAIQSGALDYLVKGQYSFTILPSLVQKAVRVREMQRAMEQYLEQIRYQAMLLDNMRDAVVVWDSNGVITYWNQAAEQLYGFPASEQVGRHIDQAYLPLFNPPVELPPADSARPIQIEHRFRRPAGDEIWISAHIMTLHSGESPGTPSGSMNVARDITEGKRVEEELARAARLASIGELAAGVAHQISNPLTTVIAEAQILSKSLDEQHPVCDSAQAILGAGWRAQAVINELMKFAQPVAGTQAMVSVNETIEAALLLAGAHIHASGIELETDLREGLPTISGNPSQLTDLWVTLLLLARSAFQQDSRRVIRIKSRLDEPDHVVVNISDNGNPIPPAEYDTIFEPRLIPTGSGRGTGMELSLCRELVRQNRGTIHISGDGSETCFQIRFPVEGASIE